MAEREHESLDRNITPLSLKTYTLKPERRTEMADYLLEQAEERRTAARLEEQESECPSSPSTWHDNLSPKP